MFEGKIKKTSHKLVAFITGLVILVSTVTISVIPAMAAENTWTVTETITATLSDEGVLTFSGTGAIPDCAIDSRPYEDAVSKATSVVVEDGITAIGKMAFASFKAATKIDVAKSVETIGQNAFNLCNNANLVIDIKGEVTSVGKNAFNMLKNTAKINVYNQTTYDAVYAVLTTTQKNKGILVLNSEGGGVDLTPQKEALSNLIDEVEKNYPEWYYTVESYEYIKTRLSAAKEALESEEATADSLNEALRSISKSANPGLFTDLVSNIQAAIDEAKKVDTSSNTASTAAALAEAIKKAQEVADKGVKTDSNVNGADQEEVTEAIEAINTAKDGLKAKASAEKVKEFEDHYLKAIRSNLGYTEDSWAEYEKVLAEYLKVYEIRNTEANDEQIDAAMKSLDEAKDKLVETRDYTEYEKAKKAVEDFLEANAKDSKYTTGSLKALQAVYDYQVSRVEENGEYIKMVGQATVDDVTKVLKNNLDPTSSSYKLALKGDVKNLAALVEEGTALIESDYTSDSWKIFSEQMAAAEKLVNDPDNAGVDAIAAAEEAVRKAIDTLVINYSYNNGEEVPPIGKIYTGYAGALTIDEETANEMINGASAIKIVFDCAPDVAYNMYADMIELEAIIAGKKINQNYRGEGDGTVGEKNISIELALDTPISTGDSISITAATYSWNEAADYVFTVTKLEYLDADGKVLKTVSGADETAKLDEFNETVDAAKALIESGNYTDDSIKALEEAVAKADALLTESNGKPLPSKMPEIVEAIEAAKNTLELKPADYTAVDEAIANVPEDLSVYTEESVKALNDAIDAVVRDKDITEQATVDGYAQAINDAISALEYLAADYTKVDEAIAKVPADLSIYTDETAAAVTAAVEAVDRTKNITEQETVDGYAKAIEDAIAALVEKPTEATTGEPITNEPTGDVTTGSDDQPTTKAPTGGKDTTKAPSTTVAPTTTAPAKGNNNGSATDKPVNTGAQAAVGLSAFLAAAAIGLVALKKRNK